MKSVILLAPMTIYREKYLFEALDNLPTFASYSPITGCQLQTADIGLVIDSSGSIDIYEWKKSLEFAVALLAHYQIGRDKVRVAHITFGTRSQLVFDFNKYNTMKDVQHGLWTAPLDGGVGTNTDIALRMAQEQMFSSVHGQRYGLVPSILFVITDGSSNNRHKTILAAKALHSTGVMVFSIGIDGAQRPELEGIASDPSLVYQISDYSKLSSLQDIIADETCLSIQEKGSKGEMVG